VRVILSLVNLIMLTGAKVFLFLVLLAFPVLHIQINMVSN